MTSGKTPYRHVYIAGCGDIGTRVARRWQAQGIAVTGIVRSTDSCDRLAQAGIDAVQCDLAQSACCLPQFEPQSLIYYFSPPPSQGQTDTHVHQLLACLAQQPHIPARIGAISTTGVYGDRGGDKVSEDEPPNPQVDRARRRYDMELSLIHI